MAAAATARKTAVKKTAAPAARTRAVKPRAAAKPKSAAAPAVSGVMLAAARPAPPPDMFPIFAIGDVQYHAPAQPRAHVELTYLWKIRHEGPQLATAYLLEELLGIDAYVALMNYEALTAQDLSQIVDLLRSAVQGAATAVPKEGLRIA
jgi:hypothetical protein